MGRPSLADVRKPQILEAFGACIVRYGAEGTTLDRVAEETGVTRGLVRHYLGNRDDVMRALAAHVRDRYTARLENLIAGRPAGERLTILLDAIFSDGGSDDLYRLAVALFDEGLRDREIASLMREMYLEWERTIDAELAATHPDADPRSRRDVAFSILALAFATSDLAAVGLPAAQLSASRRAVDVLIASLD